MEKTISDQEMELLKRWLDKSKNRNRFIEYLKIDASLKHDSLPVDATSAYNRVLQKADGLSNAKNQLPRLQFIKWTKYVGVAAIVLLAAFFYFDEESNSVSDPLSLEFVVPGTDRATLTLESGEIIDLENGKVYQNEHSSSNGKELTYSSNPSGVEKYNTLSIPRGGQYKVVLSDGTGIWLNSETVIRYPIHFIEGRQRTIELISGEAYFEVSPSNSGEAEQFVVKTLKQNVSVLGTQFNIKAYSDEGYVLTTLVEGKVKVEMDDNLFYLDPGLQTQYDKGNNSLAIEKVNVENTIAWKNGFFRFKDETLESMMNTLSRWYDMEVVFADDHKRKLRFTGALKRSKRVEELLDILARTNKISIEFNGQKTIVIK